jgi:hypothetical protein
MRSRAPLAILLASAGACAGGGPAPITPAAPALAYALPSPPLLEYVVADSARAEVQAAGQTFALNVAVTERWRMQLAAAPPDRVRVTATLTDMAARMTNPMSAPRTADEAAVSGPVVFTLDRRGRASVESLPTVTPEVAQFLSGTGTAHTFFPRLPGRAVAAGDTWTDTVAYATEEGGATIDLTSVTSYTAVGDTVMDGGTYLMVRTEGTTDQSSAGTIAGTDFSQEVSGATDGYFLWDRAAGVMHLLEVRSDLGGSMEVAVAPVALDVRVRSLVRARRAVSP